MTSERLKEVESYIKLSKSHKSRTREETECLYSYIQSLLEDVHGTDEKLSKNALEDLILLFGPLIKKYAAYYYKRVKDKYEYDDVLQEGYCIFISCCYNYKKELSVFLYYIGDNFPYYFSSWAQKVLKQSDKINEEPFIDMPHPMFNDEDSVFSRLLEDLFKREYTNFIRNLSKKCSKTTTYKTVCEKFFLGHSTRKEIAEELNISYHAVNDCINKIKRSLNYFIKNDVNFGFYFGSDKEIIIKKSRYE